MHSTIQFDPARWKPNSPDLTSPLPPSSPSPVNSNYDREQPKAAWVLDPENDAACRRIAQQATQVVKGISYEGELRRTKEEILKVFRHRSRSTVGPSSSSSRGQREVEEDKEKDKEAVTNIPAYAAPFVKGGWLQRKLRQRLFCLLRQRGKDATKSPVH